MTADVYAAWLTAGNNLQPVGEWLAANWWWLTAAIAAVFAAWAIPRSLRNANRRIDAIHADFDRPETREEDSRG